MKTRNFTSADIDPVRRLIAAQEGLVLYPPYTYWLIATHFGETSFVLEEDGRVVGYIGALPVDEGRVMFIWHFIVSAGHRGTVRGDELVNRVIDAALARGCGYLRATIRTGNTRSYNAMSRILARRGLTVRNIGSDTLRDFAADEAITFDIYQSDLRPLAGEAA